MGRPNQTGQIEREGCFPTKQRQRGIGTVAMSIEHRIHRQTLNLATDSSILWPLQPQRIRQFTHDLYTHVHVETNVDMTSSFAISTFHLSAVDSKTCKQANKQTNKRSNKTHGQISTVRGRTQASYIFPYYASVNQVCASNMITARRRFRQVLIARHCPFLPTERRLPHCLVSNIHPDEHLYLNE